MEIRGVNHRIPTLFRVRPAIGHPFCRPGAEAGWAGRRLDSGSRVSLRSPGISLK